MLLDAKHVLIVVDDQGRKEHILDAPMYSIGRDPNCDIRLVSQFVSRRHATLVQLPGDEGEYHYRIVDGAPKGKPSSNGLLVNGRKVQACDLNDHDEIMFGPKIHATYQLQTQAAEQTRPQNFDETMIPLDDWDSSSRA
ncbi:FHA domain-containing protein [Phormidium sp. CLA17]|uniref:FHA domain-containing protein n=1 Tax=Leptolyngbya sp. Cla-17 TaxID=2803751 RepID=UPI001492774E|nr:FHA domain-containing protein [Leptolyngbya sp. Cla-17]MBM0742316.1 FHA domain-containing protein [Leptolyngbya sp. Cla-17]